MTSLLLISTACLASYLPARRAAALVSDAHLAGRLRERGVKRDRVIGSLAH